MTSRNAASNAAKSVSDTVQGTTATASKEANKSEFLPFPHLVVHVLTRAIQTLRKTATLELELVLVLPKTPLVIKLARLSTLYVLTFFILKCYTVLIVSNSPRCGPALVEALPVFR